MINEKANRFYLTQATNILNEIKKEMGDIQEQNNPHIETVKQMMCMRIDDAIGWLETFKNHIK